MAAKRSGLGRGLDSLIKDKGNTSHPPVSPDVPTEDLIQYVDINQVEPNPDQPRKTFNEDTLMELSDSIKKKGVLDPLTVVDRKGYYMIVTGERRWRASRMAGLKQVPVIVRDLTDEQVAEIALIENIQRENINPIEEAIYLQKLLTEYSYKQDELAEVVSKSRAAVANSLRLLKLDQRVQQMLVDEMLTTGHARALLAIDDPERQFQAAQRVFDEKMNVRDTEKLVKKLSEKKKEEKKPSAPPIGGEDRMEAVYADAEEKMRQQLGTKVSIHRKNETTGQIEIEYYSPAELTRLVELIYSIHA